MSEAVEDARFRYRYTRRELHFPQSALAPDRPALEYRLRLQAGNAAPALVANCIIPRSPVAVRILENVFRASGVRYTTPGYLQESATISATVYEGTCNSKVGDSYDPNQTCFTLDPVVGSAPPPSSDPPPTSPGGGGTIAPGTGSGGGGSPCYDCGYRESATFSCTPSVQRGGTVSCAIQAARTSESSIIVTSWTFTDTLGRTVTSNDHTANWNGIAVTGGTVTVRFDDGSGAREVVSSFVVTDRGWTWVRNAESTFGDGTGPACLNHTPTFSVPNGYNLPMGVTNCTTGQRMIQPDSYDPAGDGFVARTVSGGPNHGFHYVASARLYLRRQSTYNSGLSSDAVRVPLQGTQRTACGIQANWYEYTRCAGYSPESVIAGVRAHEGYGTTGHNGHFSAANDAVAEPSNDPMIFFDQAIGGNSTDLNGFLTEVRAEFRVRANQADVATRDLKDGGTIVTGNYSGPYCGWLPFEGRFHCNATATI